MWSLIEIEVKRIKQLTAEQEALLAVYRDRWLAIGLSTEPGDRAAAEAAVRDAYAVADLPPPRVWIWLPSPLHGAIGAALLSGCQLIDSQGWSLVWDQVWRRIENQIGNEITGQVENQLGSRVWHQTADQVDLQVRDQVADQIADRIAGLTADHVADQVESQVSSPVWDQVVDQVRNRVWDQIGNGVTGQVETQVERQVWSQVWGQVVDQVRSPVRNQLADQVDLQVADQVLSQIRNQTADQVQNQVTGLVWGQIARPVGGLVWDQIAAWITNQIWRQVGDQNADQVRGQVTDQINHCGYGLHDAGWLSFYDYFREAVGLSCCNRLLPLIRLASHAGWWWPFRDACILTPKPSLLRRDERGRLHSETGAALGYGEAWRLWAWHGVQVEQRLITQPDTITAEEVLAERNVEVARVMLERMGIERFADEARPTILDQDHVTFTVDAYRSWIPEFLRSLGLGTARQAVTLQRRLLSIDTPHDPDRRVVAVEVVCPSTGRRYLLRVPPSMRTCTQAVAWTFGIEGEEVEQLRWVIET